MIPIEKQVSYRRKKVVLTQNVLYVCNFDMMFTFIYTSLKDIANNSRIFLNAITRPKNKLSWWKEGTSQTHLNYYFISCIIIWLLFCLRYVILTGEYYVIDSGYPCIVDFLPPYWVESYH